MLVGAGPTGVEVAGEIAVLVNHALRSEFRRIDPRSARIVRLERGNRVLAGFSEDLSAAAKQRLADLGVEMRWAAEMITSPSFLESWRKAKNLGVWRQSPHLKKISSEFPFGGQLQVDPVVGMTDPLDHSS